MQLLNNLAWILGMNQWIYKLF